MPWTELNCYHLRIDINSGRLRSEQYLYYKLIRSKEETTALSKVLYPDGNYPPPEWHCVITFDPYINNSPHYRFHGAANQIKKFDFITKNMSEVERLAVAHKIVAIWQKEKNYHAVNTYLEGIWQEQLERDSKKR